MTGGGSGDGSLYIDATANINFRPSALSTVAVTMLSGGNVGIGTTGPVSKLDIVGTAGSGGGTVQTLRVAAAGEEMRRLQLTVMQPRTTHIKHLHKEALANLKWGIHLPEM